MVGMVASVIMVFVMNNILLGVGGDVALAAFSVITTLGNASNCISTGTNGVSLTLSGILYHEEDRTGLKETLRQILRHAALIGLCMAVLLIIFAPALVSLFIPEPGLGKTLAITGFRLFAAGIVPCCLNNAFKGFYQGTGRVILMESISALEQLVFPVLAGFILSRAVGLTGAWFYFLAGEILTLVFILFYVWMRRKKVSLNIQELLLLNEDFGVPQTDLMEADVETLEEVVEVSRKASEFCRKHGQNPRLGNHLSLCIEEMGRNIITYGFGRDKGQKHLSIRLQYKEGRWVLRFRDDCHAFDPVRYLPGEDKTRSFGIRLTMHMADEARYTYSLNLNNLILVFRDPDQEAAVAK